MHRRPPRLQHALLLLFLGCAVFADDPARPSRDDPPSKREVDDLNRRLVRLYEEGQITEAVDAAKKAVDLARSKLGRGDSSYADSLNNLAAIYKSAGRYLDAEPLARQALEITRKNVRTEHPDYADCLNNLAVLYKTMGRYEDAKPLYQEALEIWRKTAGENHPNYAVLLNNLAGLYFSMGEYAEAEPRYEKAIEIKRRRLGTRHPSYATTLNNLADLYRATGRYEEAEPLYGEALSIRQDVFGSDHPDYAMSLNSLAVLYSAMGRYADAEPLFRKAAKGLARALDENHPDLAAIDSNLALLYDAIGREDQAEPLYERALKIREKALGALHPDYVTSLVHLAAFYHAQGRRGDARRLYERALDIKGKAGPPDDPTSAAILYNLALLEGAGGQARQALDLARRAFDIESAGLGRTLPISSQGQKMRFLRTLWPFHRVIQTLAFQLPGDPAARSTGLEVLLRMNAAPLDDLIWEQRCLLQQADPRIGPRLKRLSQIHSRLAFLSLTCPERTSADACYSEIKRLGDLGGALEAELALLSDEFAAARRARQVTVADVRSRLPEGAALLAYTCTPLFDFDRQQMRRPHYLVYVLRRESDAPTLTDLGEADAIDRAVVRLRKTLHERADVRDAAEALYRLILSPVERHIPPGAHLLISPEGLLGLVPFEALRQGGESSPGGGPVTYLDASRDILRLDAPPGQIERAMVVCDPDYGERPSETSRPPAGASGIGGRRFDPLPTGGEEGRAVADVFRSLGRAVRQYEGTNAAEGVLAEGGRYSVLHLAVRAFFLGDTFGNALRAEPLDEAAGLGHMARQPRFSLVLLKEDPLCRSGLAFAGANRAASSDPETRDGVAASLMLSRLDLRNTELIVLSGCDTGNGEVNVSGSISALRRALGAAGARCILMSLWQGDAAATRLLLTRFYQNWLSGRSRADALHEAKTWLRNYEDPATRQRPYTHPYYWAPFILVGDWR
ncbi:MAG: CHAT domain-containing tetratricopeptide repeat protein [Planctomycetota bacterium]